MTKICSVINFGFERSASQRIAAGWSILRNRGVIVKRVRESASYKAERMLEDSVQSYLSIVDMPEYRGAVSEGFRTLYQWILENKNRFRSMTEQYFFHGKVKKQVKRSFYKMLQNSNVEEMHRQIMIMDAALYKDSMQDVRTHLHFTDGGNAVISNVDYEKTSMLIGDYLCKEAIIGVDGAGRRNAAWIGSNPLMMKRNDYSYVVTDGGIYNGNDGIALYLLNLWKITKKDSYLETGRYAMQSVINRMRVELDRKQMIAGCIPYLYQLYLIDRDERVYALFKELLSYERSYFYDYIKNGWITEERVSNKEDDWTYGIPGILIEKIMLKELGYEDASLSQEIDNAIYKVKEECMGKSLSYAHGDFANLEILMYAAYVMGNDSLFESCRQNYHKLYKRFIKEHWNDSRKGYCKAKGLMNGIAGVGYSLLRMSRFEETDAFLWLR